MGINDRNIETQAQTQTRSAGTMNFQQQEQTKQASTRPMSFHGGSGSAFGSVVDRSVKDSQLRKVHAALVEIYKNVADKNLEAVVDMVDNVNNPALRFSSIVVGLRNKTNPGTMAFYTMIFESSGILEPRTETINGQPVEIVLTAGDAFDKTMIDVIEARLTKAYNNVHFICCDALVVPRTFNPDDQDALYELALNAGMACGTELEIRNPDFKDLDLAAARDGNLRINVQFNRDEVKVDSVGLPVRSDIVIQLTSHVQGNNQTNQTLNNGDRITKISEVTGFVDLVYAPEQQQNAFNPYAPMQQQQGINRLFVPRFVITSIKSEFSYTPASVLLAVYTALALEEKMNWIQTFLSTRQSKAGELDIRDIGYINLEAMIGNVDPQATIGQPVDTRTSAFGLQQLGDFVSRTVRPNLIVSLDVPVCGSQSWFTGFMPAAARGVIPAVKAFEKAANSLTNGNFDRMLQHGVPYFTDVDNKQHLGYYSARSESGQRDIRDIDRVAICNFFASNPREFRDWDESLNRTDYPLAIRMQHRLKRIRAITGETANITGYADRVTFTGPTLKAIAEGAKAAGMSVQINTPLNGSDFNSVRTTATFADSAMLGGGSMFNQQQSSFVSGNTAYQNSNRWSV